MNLTAVLFVLTVSLGILFYIIKKVVPFLILTIKDFKEEKRFIKIKRQLEKIDEFFDNEEYSQALSLIKKSFILDETKNTRRYLDEICELNINLLARMIGMTSDFSSSIKNIGTLEEYLNNYQKLIEKKYEKIDFLKNMRKKHDLKDKGKWAEKEIQDEIKKIKENIVENKKKFFKELEQDISYLEENQRATRIIN